MITRRHRASRSKKKGEKKKNILLRGASVVVCAVFAFSGFYHPEKKNNTESGIEPVVGRSDIKPTYREIAQAFELDFDFVSL